MKKYLAIYIANEAALEQARREAAEANRPLIDPEGMKPWLEWVKANADSIVEMGRPVGRTKQLSSEGTSDPRNNITGYTVVQAGSHEAAAKLFENHPHITVFPGSTVEIMECLDVPGM